MIVKAFDAGLDAAPGSWGAGGVGAVEIYGEIWTLDRWLGRLGGGGGRDESLTAAAGPLLAAGGS